MGQPAPRIDGRRKVTGAARYPSDLNFNNMAYAYLVTSGIARGRIERLDLDAARAVPGVLDILTHENASQIKGSKFFNQGGTAATTIVPLSSPKVWHDGQIIAMVLAESYEAAREAAFKVEADYAEEQPTATFGSPGAETETVVPSSEDKATATGDVEAAFAAAEVTLDAEYGTPTQHHNPIELFTTTCLWSDDELTIYEPSQFVYGIKNGVAEQLGIDASKVRVVSTFIGGAFGSKGSLTPRTAITAFAARKLKRPVKLVPTRAQGFTITTNRAETRHHIRLGASRDGKLCAYSHEGWEITSRPDNYFVGGIDSTVRMYAYGAVSAKVNVVHADRNTPGFMRSPPETPYMYALENAIDELAVKLNIDPVELRRINDTMSDPVTGRPYTSRSLMQCYDAASEAFGWSRRTPQPGSMREGDWLVGWGCATATYPTHSGPASARVRLSPDGKVRVQVAAHDIGTGAYTVVGQMAAERLGVALDAVTVELGDTDFPAAPVAGGSNTTASVCSTVLQTCNAIRDKLFQAVTTAGEGALAGHSVQALDLREGKIVASDDASETFAEALDRLGQAKLEEYVEWTPPGVPAGGIKKLYSGAPVLTGGAGGKKLMFAFGAEFVEVRIHARTGEIRVPRAVGAFAAGHIMNTRTARSQLMGGIIWGISSALHEETELDQRAARYVNTNISEYYVPVNADVDQVEVMLVPEEDHEVNPAGVKGIGELGNVGTAAAVANAVYHATGKRIRDLPIRIEDIL
jgi:xanthine dehydrogenase YagR molybdenum-binding subunit